ETIPAQLQNPKACCHSCVHNGRKVCPCLRYLDARAADLEAPDQRRFHRKLTQPGAEGEASRTANEVQTNQICTALIKVRASSKDYPCLDDCVHSVAQLCSLQFWADVWEWCPYPKETFSSQLQLRVPEAEL